MDASSKNSSPLVAVVGALGTQGASVITALTSSPATATWRIRALTSSPNSAAAKALSASNPNVSIVECNVNDIDSVRDAFRNCSHIFANSTFPGPTLLSDGPEAAERLEHRQAMNLVRAAAATESLRHLVFSTLVDSSVISGGKWKVPHFSSKQEANAFVVGGYPGDGVEGAAKKEEGWGSLRHKSTLMCVTMYGSNLVWDPYRPRKKVSDISTTDDLLTDELTLAGRNGQRVRDPVALPCRRAIRGGGRREDQHRARGACHI